MTSPTAPSDYSNGAANTPYVDTLSTLPPPPVFYEKYVKRRRPVVFKDCCQHVTPKLQSAVSSLDKLLDIVGKDTLVEVNQRVHNDQEEKDVFSPSNSRVIEMRFGDLIKHLEEGSSDYYMTTQTLPPNEEGQPLLYTSPITQLVKSNNLDSLIPPLLGNLVPMTVNLWMGCSSPTEGTSSGLHHDYHDNLYCLLEGSKEFQIAPPESIHKLKTVGTLHTLHDNGRIVYQEQLSDNKDDMIRPDGALESVEAIMKLEIRKKYIEAQLESETDPTKLQELEEELDTVQDKVLDLEMNGNNNEKEGVFGGDDHHSSSSESENEPNPKKARMESNHDEKDIPLNFVIETSDVEFQTAQLSKGDLLYLPAGWFHKVTSKGNSNDNKGGLHIAFNYWMHPPDVGDEVTFEHPYLSKFWQRDWETRDESKAYR